MCFVIAQSQSHSTVFLSVMLVTVREGTFFLGGGGGRAGEFWDFFRKKCWPSLAF